MSQKINVLILESIFHLGGVETLTYNVVKGMNKERFNVVLCTLYYPGPMGEPFMNDGFVFYHDLIKSKFDVRAFLKLRKIIVENEIDVIYLITQPLTLFWGVIIGKFCKVPIVCLIGNTVFISEHIKLNIYRWMLPLVDKIVAQANMQKDHWVKNVGVPEHLISVIYNGISNEQFSTEVNRNEKLISLGINPSNKIVGIVGRLVDLKGIDVFLHAAELVIKENQEVHFVIVGDGPEMRRFKSLVKELGINKKVELLGFRDDLPELVSVFDIAVLSSRTEAMPMVILEYMACGKPIIATRVGSVPEFMIDGVTGLLINPEDHNTLAEKIVFLLRDEGYAAKMGREGKKMVYNKFRIEGTVEKIERLFEELVEK